MYLVWAAGTSFPAIIHFKMRGAPVCPGPGPGAHFEMNDCVEPITRSDN